MQLAIRDLSKTYPNGTQALKDVSLDVPPGMFGLLGRERRRQVDADADPRDAAGAGRGDDPPRRHRRASGRRTRVRETLGYLPQSFGFHPTVSAERLLDHFAVLKGIVEPGARRDVVESLLRRTNLWEVRKQQRRHVLRRHAAALRRRRRAARQPEADHRRRADGGARPGGARALPEPAERDRRGRAWSSCRRTSSRTSRSCAAAWRSSTAGEILLEAEPLRAIDELRGRIWRRTVSRDELPALEREHAGDLDEAAGGTDDRARVRRGVAGRGVRAGRAGPEGRVLQRHGAAPRPRGAAASPAEAAS